MTADDLHAELEKTFGKARTSWTSAEWQKAAGIFAQLCSLAFKQAAMALETARMFSDSAGQSLESGLASDMPPTIAPERGLASATRRAHNALHSQSPLPDIARRVTLADHQLRQLLASPYGREAYVRLTRDRRDEPRRLLARPKGSIPAAKGQMAALLLPKPPSQKSKMGRPRKVQDSEVERLARLFDQAAADLGRKLETPNSLRAVLKSLGADISIPRDAIAFKLFAKQISEERKRQRRLSGR